jgi:ABC-2 type transport system ATP-binding protein
VRAGTIAELTAGTDSVRVRTPNLGGLLTAVATVGGQARPLDAGTADIRGLSAAAVGHIAFSAGVELHELVAQRFDLEQLFFALTAGPPMATPPMPGGPAWVG